MQNYVSEIARKPYLVPPQTDRKPFYPSYPYGESTESLFWSNSQNSADDLPRKFENLERNLPEMVHLQDQKLESGPKPNVHDGNPSLFLENLTRTDIHPYSLCPFPMEIITINELMQQIIDSKVPPDRAAWALHYFITKSGDPSINLTNMLLQLMDNTSDPTYDPDYIAKLSFYCYEKNILDQYKFLMGAITKLPPKSLLIFKPEIIRTHSVLTEGFKNPQIIDSLIHFFHESIMLQKSHLIQYSILYNYYYYSSVQTSNPYTFLIKFKPYMNSDSLRRRAKRIFEIITPTQLTFSTLLRDVLISFYPYYDVVKFRHTVEKTIPFIPQEHEKDQEGLKQVVMDIIEIIEWFNDEIRLPALSIAISTIISLLPLDKENFPLDEFVQYIYDHIENCNNYVYLFIELQKDNYIQYIEFIKAIKKFGFIITRPDQTLKIISNFPFYKRDRESSIEFYRLMKRYNQDQYDMLLAQITDADPVLETAIIKNIDLCKQLPYTALFGLCSFMIKNCRNLTEASDILFSLKVYSLLPEFFERIEKTQDLTKIDLSIRRVFLPKLMQLVPILILHDKLSILTSLIVNNLKDPVLLDLGIFIREHYEHDRGQLSNIQELSKSNRGNVIYPKEVMNLFRRFSYLCSLHIFDAFHCVENLQHFDQLFKIFMKDLLSFHSLRAKTLFNFFIEFTQSQCLARPMNFFIKTMLSVLLNYTEEEFTDRLNNLLEQFFESVFEQRIFLPSSYLAESSKKRVRGPSTSSFNPSSKLIQILLNIAHKRPELFTPSNCFNDNSIKAFIQEPRQLAELIEELKKGPLPQLTDDLLNTFGKSVAAPPVTLQSTYFALLPDEARDKDFNNVFQYFIKNARPDNCRFLAYWIKYFIFFTCTPASVTANSMQGNGSYAFPVLFTQTDKQKVAMHHEIVAKAFFNLFMNLTDSEEDKQKCEVYLSAWSLICQTDKVRYQTPSFANAALKYVASQITPSTGIRSQYIIDFIKPVLIIPLISMDQLVDTCFKLHDKEENFVFAATVFVSYLTHCVQEPRRDKIELAAQCLLKWLPKIPELRYKCYDFILDAFNFIICFSKNVLTFQDQMSLHNSIRPYYLMIPDYMKDKILLNIPPQSFTDTKEPLYLNVQADEQPPPTDIFPPMPMEQKQNDFVQPLETFTKDFNDPDEFSWFDLN